MPSVRAAHEHGIDHQTEDERGEIKAGIDQEQLGGTIHRYSDREQVLDRVEHQAFLVLCFINGPSTPIQC